MRCRIIVAALVLVGNAQAQTPDAKQTKPRASEQPNPPALRPGAEEFGLTPKELVLAIEKVEALIAQYMREQGFEYVSCDYQTIRKGMSADKILPGMSEQEFISKFGFGVSTFYTGKPPQLSEGYCPAREGLGERNIQIFQALSPAQQVEYNRALFGDNPDASFAVGLESEDFSRCGGCTRKAIEQVFMPDQLEPNYLNPKDTLIAKHPLMQSALKIYASEMHQAGLNYNHPDEVEADVRERLDALTNGGKITLEQMGPEQQEALKKLQDYERTVALKNLELQRRVLDPAEDRILKYLYPRQGK